MSEPLLRCEGLTKVFGGLRAVDGVDFELHAGEVRGLVGPNGSGKSTTINLLSGHLQLDGGSIAIGGTRVEDLAPHKISSLGLARTYQIPRPFSTLTVLENVRVAAHFGAAEPRPEDVDAEAQRWVEFVGLGHVAHLLPDTITLHQRKLLELGRALATRPRVLFLDEVLAGLNPRELVDGIALVHRIKDLGISIVVVEHIMRVILDLCDHLTVLNFGKVIAQGEPQACLRDDEVVTAYLGGHHA
ncbi:MAG TPA: ABC transporter ATP-binding protein [Egicoccus sp.]|nr:ABC transporter ATP-binding protein [Egicoccus sp.]HSK23042.1 ABC transporter ATP-binding protein [Egicoccus sp.]